MWLGDLAPEQASRGSRRGHPSNKGIPNKGVGMVQCGNGSGMEEYLPNHSGESQNRDNTVGSSSMGSDTQSMVELHNGHSIDFMGGVQSFEQAEKAINGASL